MTSDDLDYISGWETGVKLLPTPFPPPEGEQETPFAQGFADAYMGVNDEYDRLVWKRRQIILDEWFEDEERLREYYAHRERVQQWADGLGSDSDIVQAG